jgi:deazaflavin-dependent oxidoreductase (nitroreductase family)
MSFPVPDTVPKAKRRGGLILRFKTKPPARFKIIINKGIVRLNVYVYRKSGGKILGRFGHLDALLITTLGRKTGKTRTNPVGYIYDSGRFVVCGAYGGEAIHPAWFLNLRAIPQATVEIGREKIDVLAEVLPAGEERDRIWKRMVEVFPGYAKFQNMTDRVLPVVLLTPRVGIS